MTKRRDMSFFPNPKLIDDMKCVKNEHGLIDKVWPESQNNKERKKANERKIRKQYANCGLTAWLAVRQQRHPSSACTMLGLM